MYFHCTHICRRFGAYRGDPQFQEGTTAKRTVNEVTAALQLDNSILQTPLLPIRRMRIAGHRKSRIRSGGPAT